MRKFLPILLSLSLYGIDGTKWSDFGITLIPTTRQNLIVLTQDSTLTLTTQASPQSGGQFYDGNLEFQGAKLLTINLTLDKATQKGYTPIYWQNTETINAFTCAKMSGGEGTCSIIFNIDLKQSILNHLINIERGTLTVDQNITLNLTPNGKVNSIFYISEKSTLEFDGGFFVDLRDQEGTFTHEKLQGTRKVIIEHYGVSTKINTYSNPFAVQMYGDIISAGQRFALNLLTPNSIFEGKFDIGDSPHYFSQNDVTLANSATANIDLTFLSTTSDAPQRFTLNLSKQSKAILNATFDRTKYALLDLIVSNSTLYANFSYSAISNNQRGDKDSTRIAINTQGQWITTQNAFADEIFFNVEMPTQPPPIIPGNPSPDPPSPYPPPLIPSGSGGIIDLRFSDFNGTPRKLTAINETNRITLTSKIIAGNAGIFKLYGVLNRNSWGKDAQGNMIATDLIITQNLKGKHLIQIHWEGSNFDESLLQEDLLNDRIIVAKQLSPTLEGDFIGASAPIGLLEYTTPLTREEVKDAQGQLTGYEWIIGKIPPPQESQPPRPSYLSRTLNAIFAIPYKTFLSQAHTLHQRLGDLRYLDRTTGLWLQTDFALLLSQESAKEISALSMHTHIALGADYGFYSLGGKNFLGISINFTPLQDFGQKDAYLGNSLAYGFSVYETTLFDNGIYTDLVFKYYFADHQYTLNPQEFAQEKLNFSSHSFLGSFELGYKFRLPIATPNFDYSFYYLTPRFNLTLGAILSSQTMQIQHRNNYVIDAKLLSTLPTQPSLSVDFGRRFDNQKLLGDVFVSLGAEYTFNAGNVLELQTPFNSGTFKPEDIFNLKIGVGGNVILMSGARFYFEVNSKFLGRIAPVLNLTAGARIPLGSKYQRNTPPSTPSAPIIYGNSHF